MPETEAFPSDRDDTFICVLRYLILLISLIREKNNKVKEILKVLGIEPLLNNIAQGLR